MHRGRATGCDGRALGRGRVPGVLGPGTQTREDSEVGNSVMREGGPGGSWFTPARLPPMSVGDPDQLSLTVIRTLSVTPCYLLLWTNFNLSEM